MIEAVQPSLSEIDKHFVKDAWSWSEQDKSDDVNLSGNACEAYFYVDPVKLSTGTAGARADTGFTTGIHYWEIVFLEPPRGTSVMVGVGTKQASLDTYNYSYVHLLGQDQESWGLNYLGTAHHGNSSRQYCNRFLTQNTTIGCLLDLYRGTLSFYVNGEFKGTAFGGLAKRAEPLFPMISSTAAEAELGIGSQRCYKYTLPLSVISLGSILKSINYKREYVESLPLPPYLKRCLLRIIEAFENNA